MKIIGTVERSKTGYYSIYPDKSILNYSPFGYGDSMQEAKDDFMLAIEEGRQLLIEEGMELPKECETIEVEYRYAISTIFEAFSFLNVSQFAKFAGINESKMRQYTSGLCDPGVKASKKIAEAMKTIGNSLLAAVI
ncbi:MAG: pilus assembly protein HicB [Bacteroidales bacterium]|nr:pilus assembly protein HicB [Bacteroidales bacterium]